MKAGERLADLHLNYEKQQEMEKIAKKEKLDWRLGKKCASAGGSEANLTILAPPPAAPVIP